MADYIENPNGIIIDVVTAEALEFFYYSEIQNTVSADYKKKVVRGRSEPHQHYNSNGPDTIAMNIVLVASMFQGDGGSYEDAINQWRFFKSLLFPDYLAGSYIGGPHLIRLKLGDLYDEEGILAEFSSILKPPFNRSHLPGRIECSFVFERIGVPKGYSDVRLVL
jgi:hypothetical protein